jgi:hypothetical protein
MAKTNRNANDLKEWDQLATATAANAADLPQAEIPRAGLEKLRDEMRGLVVEQSLRQSEKQQISQRMAEIHRDGAKLATVLRVLAKQHYGNRNEKLVEFGIQPFRGRARKANPAVETPPPAGTPSTSSTPK